MQGTNSDHDLTLALFYRPPISSPFVIDSQFDYTFVSKLECYLIGDFNIDYFCTSHPLYCNHVSAVSSFNLTQVVAI